MSQIFKLTALFVILLLAALLIPMFIYGNARPVRLASAPALSGEIAQALGVNDKGKLPVANKDFSMKQIKYFDNNAWAFVTITEPNVGDGYVVLQRKDQVYNVVLGPGTQFDPSYQQSLPSDLVQFLKSKGLF